MTRDRSLAHHASIDAVLVTVIIPHFEYSSFIRQSLMSVLAQSHQNFEVIIVDDASSEHECNHLMSVVEAIDDPRIRVRVLPVNVGQIMAVYRGLDDANGEFITLLDPDDHYDPDFLHMLLAAHLSPFAFASISCSEMGQFVFNEDRSGGSVISRDGSGMKRRSLAQGCEQDQEKSLADKAYSLHIPPWIPGWHWATTSSLMFRRDALEALRPLDIPTEIRFSADAYCAQGAHILGGTLFVDRVLSWRGIHGANTARQPFTIGRRQIRQKASFIDQTLETKRLAIENVFVNGYDAIYSTVTLGEMLTSHFVAADIKLLAKRNSRIRECLLRFGLNLD